MKIGAEYVLKNPSAESLKCVNYQRWRLLIQSRDSDINVQQFKGNEYSMLAFQCEEIGKNRNRFDSPERPIELPSTSRLSHITQDCFHGDAWKVHNIQPLCYPIPMEIQHTLSEKGYYDGMRVQVHAVDRLLRSANRRRAYMDSCLGKFMYNEADQWSNFDIMDIISMTLVSRPQPVHGKRSGLHQVFVILQLFLCNVLF